MAYNILNLIPKAIQDALGLKANSDSPVFTGNVTLPSGTSIGPVTPQDIIALTGTTGNIQAQLTSKASQLNVDTNVSNLLSLIDGKQPTGANLTALNALSSTGFAVRNGTNTWVQRGLVGPSAGITISNANGVAGNPTFALSNDLLGLENLNTTGFPVRTATDTWTQRQFVVQGPISITNANGVAGNPTIGISGATSSSSGVVPGIDGAATGNVVSINRLTSSFTALTSPLIHSGQSNLIILPPSFSKSHNIVINLTGLYGASGDGNRNITLGSAGLTDGTSLDILFNIAPISNMNVMISGNGALLDSFLTDNSADKARARFVVSNGSWAFFGGNYPA